MNERFFYKKHNVKKPRPILPKTLGNMKGYRSKPKKHFFKNLLVNAKKKPFYAFYTSKNMKSALL